MVDFQLGHLPLFRKKIPPPGQASLAGGLDTSLHQPAASPPQDRLSQGLTSLQDIIAPPAIDVDFTYLKIGGSYFRTLFVAGYPRFVNANWLSPLINFNHSLDVAMYIYPVEGKGILDDLKRKIGEMEAEIQTDLQRGRIANIETQVKLEDARALQEQLAKGSERFFQFGLYVTIQAVNEKELETVTKQVQSTLGSLLIVAKTTTLQMGDAFNTTIPYCQDKLMINRNMDTTSLATTFPFTSSELTANEGILYGLNQHNGSLIIFDRFTLENANSVVFAKSGAGKSLEYNETVLIKNAANEAKRVKIGPLIEKLIAKKGSVKIDREIEGCLSPKVKVFAFNPFTMKTSWSNVTIAARKKSPELLYKFTTKSGREITTTGDHNILTLKNAKISVVRGSEVRIGNPVPIPRKILGPNPKISNKKLDYYTLLGYYTAEGCLTKYSVRISNTNLQVIRLLKQICQRLGYNHALLKKAGLPIGVAINSRPLIRKLKLDKCTGYAGEKRVPATLFSQGDKAKSTYLRAYFSGDGSVENHEITCTTKSKQLSSDLAYLLYNFGIVGRIKPKRKKATSPNHQGNVYYQLTISGQANLKRFKAKIDFNIASKQRQLKALINRRLQENTNVDTIPGLAAVFKELYYLLYSSSGSPAPESFSPIKNGVFNPSPGLLASIIEKVEKRIAELETLEKNIGWLNQLPPIDRIVELGATNKEINAGLWKELGQSWRLMKQNQIQPGIINVLRAHAAVGGHTVTITEAYQVVHQTFSSLGESLRGFNKSLWTAIVHRHGDTSYKHILGATYFLSQKYQEKRLQLARAKQLIKRLRALTTADLFWDPIIKIEQLPAQHPYVYDLQVNKGVFLAGHGGMFVHNSYMVKLEILRSLMFDSEIIVIDPENEYQTLCEAVDGEYITFSFDSPAKINPFDLSQVYEEGENELGLKILSLHSLFKIIMGQMTAEEEAILDRALVLTYKQKNITPEPATQKNEPPLMEDLYKVLVGMEEPQSASLAARLEKFIKGSLRGIFDQRSNVNLENPFTVFSIKELEDELRPIAMFIILDYIWTKVKRDLKKRLLIVDEAWYLMKHPDSALFLYGMAKRARKYFLGVTTITQDVEDFLASDYGKAIVTNSSIQTLMKQSPAAIDKIAAVFYLSQGEKNLLLAAAIGEGLFFAGANHVAMKVIASPEEHRLVTSKPEEVLAIRQGRALETLSPLPQAETTSPLPPPQARSIIPGAAPA